MSANALLLWMSARGQGSWHHFRTAVEELHVPDDDEPGADEDEVADPFALPLYQALRLNLQRFGHAEFFSAAAENEWRVTPPALSITQVSDGWRGVVVGARSAKLLTRIERGVAPGTLEVNQLAACPDGIQIRTAGVDELKQVAACAGLSVRVDAPLALLACLPAIDDPSVRQPFEMPFGAGWKVKEFSPADLRWRDATLSDAQRSRRGLFRLVLNHQTYNLFCFRGKAYRMPGAVGKYLTLRRQRHRVVRYDPATSCLTVPAICRPPFVIERALILQSGSLPTYERPGARSGILRYAGIPEALARLTSALLRQDMS